jgi:DNA-binding SARP family transcriptional activator
VVGSQTARIYVAGQVAIETEEVRLDEREFGGRLVRLTFALLVVERNRPFPREELANVLWSGALPPSWASALRGVLTKVRHVFTTAGLTSASLLTHSLGSYHIQLPDSTLVDVELAAEAVQIAEQALRDDDAGHAWGPALAAAAVARRPFLTGDEGPWVEHQRAQLHILLVRALHALSESRLRRGEVELALAAAEEAAHIAPYRESAHRHLMQAHAAAGNRAEALRGYERCRVLLASELGVDPSPETQSLYLTLLKAGTQEYRPMKRPTSSPAEALTTRPPVSDVRP